MNTEQNQFSHYSPQTKYIHYQNGQAVEHATNTFDKGQGQQHYQNHHHHGQHSRMPHSTSHENKQQNAHHSQHDHRYGDEHVGHEQGHKTTINQQNQQDTITHNHAEQDIKHNHSKRVHDYDQQQSQQHKMNGHGQGYQMDKQIKQQSQLLISDHNHHHNHIHNNVQQHNNIQFDLANQFDMPDKQEQDSNQFMVNQNQSEHHYHHQHSNQQDGPFNWGQQENQSSNYQKQKIRVEDFFIKPDFDNSVRLSTNSNHKHNQQQHKIHGAHKIVKQKNPKDDIDIWKDLRESMLQKSIVSSLLKNSKVEPAQKPKLKQSPITNPQKPVLFKLHSSKSKKKHLRKSSSIQQGGEVINKIQQMNKMISEKVKKWKKQQKEIQARRIQKLQQQNKRIKAKQILEQQQMEKRKKQQRMMRVKAASQRLEKKHSKSERKLESSPNKSQNKKKIIKLNKSKTEKTYKLKKQVQHKGIDIHSSGEIQQNFSMHWNKKNDNIKIEKEKLLRRKIFQQKVRQLPVPVSPDKKIKLLIDIDKSNNPLKYQLLHKKGLTDEQIYNHSQLYRPPEDPKKIGVKYLQDLREKNKLDDIRRYMSQESLANMQKYERSWKSPNLDMNSDGLKLDKIKPKASPIIFNPLQQKRRRLLIEDDQYLNSLRKVK